MWTWILFSRNCYFDYIGKILVFSVAFLENWAKNSRIWVYFHTSTLQSHSCTCSPNDKHSLERRMRKVVNGPRHCHNSCYYRCGIASVIRAGLYATTWCWNVVHAFTTVRWRDPWRTTRSKRIQLKDSGKLSAGWAERKNYNLMLPSQYAPAQLRHKGSYYYHDWSNLVLISADVKETGGKQTKKLPICAENKWHCWGRLLLLTY